MRLRISLGMMCALALVGAGCGGGGGETPDSGSTADTGPVQPDGGPHDGGPNDAGHDAGAITPDGGHDAGSDTGTTTNDAGMDGGNDAAVGAADFRIDSLDTTNCTTIDVYNSIGDDHGGISIATDRVLLGGDGNGPTSVTGIFPLDLSSTSPLIPEHRDIVVSDLASGTLYLLADDNGPLPFDGGGLPTMLSALVVANDDLSAGATTVTLSTPIAIDYDTGIFAGAGEIGIHDGTHLWLITLATGAVTDLGAVTIDHDSCETWAYWGVLEHAGANRSVIVSAGGTSGIHRVDVATGTVTDVGGFADVADMCSISVSPATHRWYFHVENNTQFNPAVQEALGFCDATIDTTGGGLSVTALTATNCTVQTDLENTAIGDDHGGIAVTTNYVYLAGDTAAGRWSLDLATHVVSFNFPTVGPALDGIVTNLHGGTTWSLATDTALFDVGTGGDMTRLVQIDDTGAATTTVITLSQPIPLTTITDYEGPSGLFAGWDEIAILDGQTDTHVWLIALPSGTVTDLGAMTTPASIQLSETWAVWGVVERFGGAHHLVAHSTAGTDPAISRYLVPDGTETVISTFTDISDLASFTLGPTFDRWYFHHEYQSQLTTGMPAETLGFCDAHVTHP